MALWSGQDWVAETVREPAEDSAVQMTAPSLIYEPAWGDFSAVNGLSILFLSIRG
jgi:hypothetical protein